MVGCVLEGCFGEPVRGAAEEYDVEVVQRFAVTDWSSPEAIENIFTRAIGWRAVGWRAVVVADPSRED